MQTFLPYEDYTECARVLDKKRLFKQTVECLQIIRAITYNTGWRHHPCIDMWKFSLGELVIYSLEMVGECEKRNIDMSGMKTKLIVHRQPSKKPFWLGDARVYISHRSNLLRKDETYYRKYGWTEPTTLPYYWPKINDYQQ